MKIFVYIFIEMMLVFLAEGYDGECTVCSVW
jgi:hypothetical protein